MAEEEAGFDVPVMHEAVMITTDLIAPTIRAVGTDDQRERYLRPMLRTDHMWCQLFSEPAQVRPRRRRAGPCATGANGW